MEYESFYDNLSEIERRKLTELGFELDMTKKNFTDLLIKQKYFQYLNREIPIIAVTNIERLENERTQIYSLLEKEISMKKESPDFSYEDIEQSIEIPRKKILDIGVEIEKWTTTKNKTYH